jgi:hypothetical protein
VRTFERAVELQTSSITLDAKLIKIASETLDSDTFVSFGKNGIASLDYGRKSRSLKFEDLPELDSLVNTMASVYSSEDYLMVTKIKAFAGMNECLTSLVVEHKICMILGISAFFLIKL